MNLHDLKLNKILKFEYLNIFLQLQIFKCLEQEAYFLCNPMKNKQELCRNHQKKKEKKEEKKHEYSSYTDQELKDFSSEN